MTHPLVILGSGLAGCSMVREMRKLDPERPMVMVCADAGEVYAKPNLSIALAGKRVPDAIVTATATQFAEQHKVVVRACTVVRAIDTARRHLVTEQGPLAYEALVLAVGARQVPLPGVPALDRVVSVNSLDDYRRFRERVDGCRRVIVVGAGFIGCEFANDLRSAGIDVDVVDLAPHPLARFWPPQLAQSFEQRLAAAGVRWHLGRRVAAVEEAAGEAVVTLDDGSALRGDLVLSALGLAPCTELARAAGLQVGRGIRVDARLATSAEGIYALGDCAEIEGQVWPFVMPILHSARALARTLTGTPTPVRFPPMPVTLKTPACPAVFLPAPTGAQGRWALHAPDTAVFEADDGTPRGVTLVGDAVKRREEWIKRLSVVQATCINASGNLVHA